MSQWGFSFNTILGDKLTRITMQLNLDLLSLETFKHISTKNQSNIVF